MIRYKIDIMAELKNVGITTTVLRDRKLIYPNTIRNIKSGKEISLSTLNMICILLGCDIKDIIEFDLTDSERREYGKLARESDPDRQMEPLLFCPEPEDSAESRDNFASPTPTKEIDVLTTDEASAYGRIYSALDGFEGFSVTDNIKEAMKCPGKVIFDFLKDLIASGRDFDKAAVLEQLSQVDVSHANYQLSDEGQNYFIMEYMKSLK